jgi:glycosyltransferase involved in cell wall biosynthesis
MQVSVVIPCYNSLKYLPATLDAVLAQELPPSLQNEFEVILVDDGGSDDLSAWVQQRGDDRVRVVRQENAGVSAARNLGIASAAGQFVAFCDSDDMWNPRAMAELYGCFGADPTIGLAYGFYEVVDASGASTGRIRKSQIQGDVWEQFLTQNPVGASGVMVRREVFDRVGVFAENRDRFRVDVEDWELWIRIAATWRVGLTPTVVVRYRRHDGNSSTDLDSLDAAYRNLLEVVFAGVGPQRTALRPLATGKIAMILAWQSLNDAEDPERAIAYLQEAVVAAPELRRTAEFWRLRTAAGALSFAGSRGYHILRSANGWKLRLKQKLQR